MSIIESGIAIKNCRKNMSGKDGVKRFRLAREKKELRQPKSFLGTSKNFFF
jgi:hypothetical protein